MILQREKPQHEGQIAALNLDTSPNSKETRPAVGEEVARDRECYTWIGIIMVWNRLSDRKISRIITLHREGLSYPQIARRLEVNRETVGRYVRKLKEPTRVVSVALYSSDIKKLKTRANNQNKSLGDIVRETVHKGLRQSQAS